MNLLITPTELAGLLTLTSGASDLRPLAPSSSVQIIDTRPAEDFAAGRIPGAIHIDLWAFSLNDTDSAPLKSFLWMIAHVLSARGVDPSRTAVVYDDKSGIRAARVFWFLEYFGHPDARVLDGGFSAWTRAVLRVETSGAGPEKMQGGAGPEKMRGGAGLQTGPRDWPEHEPRHDERLATWREVKDRIGKPNAVILDTRSDAEYYGEVARAKRAGAVPGAVHIEWTHNLDEAGAFKPADELRAMYEQAGVTPDRDVVTYCQGGYRAAHSYLALRLLGYPRVRTYLGSWKEWGDREELPIEIPTRQP